MEDPALIHQCQVNSLNDSIHEFTSFSSETYSTYPSFYLKSSTIQTSQIGIEKPTKQLKTNNWNSYITEKLTPRASSSTSSNLISFGNSHTAPDRSEPLFGNQNCTMNPYDALEFGEETQRFCTAARTPLPAKDHVLAERKRREMLSLRFIAFSALLPGLKKASVLGDAARYIKQLQEHVKTLEEEARKKPVESVVCVKKSWLCGYDDTSSSNKKLDSSSTQLFPEIEVKISDNDVLIRIQCEKHKRFVSKIFSEIQTFHLIVINGSVMPLGHTTLAITIIAQMDVQFSMTAKDLAKSLRSALQN